jgi:phosphoribosylformylglycinamidine cyclo-ligase
MSALETANRAAIRHMAEPRRSAYVSAGVDVDAGEQAVELMRAAVESTRRPEVIGGLGGFGGAVTIPAGYGEPVIVSSTDGVGTKTAIASALGRFDTVGIDLVAMCADDVVCTGAEPLFFLDYIAVGQLDPPQAAELVDGVADGCRQAGCALVGGETAEHPGLMDAMAFDLAGCCVGVVERNRLIDATAAEPGDAIVGLASNGLHSNGYSLVRSLIARWDLDLGRPYQEQLHLSLGTSPAAAAIRAEPEHGLATLGEVLLAPTRIYARSLLALRETLVAAGHDLKGLAHITGGGLPGNVHRALPSHLGARLDPATWRIPSVMRLMAALGGMDDEELRGTFNGGLGMIVVVSPAAVDATVERLTSDGITASVVGTVVPVDELGGARYAEGPLR